MRRAPLLLVVVVLVVAGCRGGTVGAFRLEHDASSLQSLAADGSTVANSAVKGDTTDAFVRVHSSELAHEAGKLADALASAKPEPELRIETSRLIVLTRRVGAALERLENEPGNRPLARHVRALCSDAAKRAEMLGESA